MYEAYYGFSGKPFQLNPDPGFFFGSKGHRRAMSYLEYGLHQGEGFIVITGEVGAGKTTLVRNLFNKLDPATLAAAQLVSTQLDADDMLRAICAAFDLPHEDASKAILLNRLEAFLLDCHARGKRALLVVDEAQNLSPRAVEELRMLSNFQSANQSLLQSFLLGQPEFRHILQSPGMRQLKQRVIASYHLGPIDRGETQAYIEHRLHHVGWRGVPSFSDGAYDAIFEFSGGIPRKINTLCDRLMLMGSLEELEAFDRDQVQVVIDDFVNEFSIPDPRSQEQSGQEQSDADLESGMIDPGFAHLDARVSKIEKSVYNVLKLSRQILSLPSVRQTRDEGK